MKTVGAFTGLEFDTARPLPLKIFTMLKKIYTFIISFPIAFIYMFVYTAYQLAKDLNSGELESNTWNPIKIINNLTKN